MARTAKKEKALTPEEKLAQALVPDVEQPYRVPDNWCWVWHNSILDISGGSQPDKSLFIPEPKTGYTQLYQTRDYGEHPIPVFIPDKYATKTTVEGDILLARYGGSLGKVFKAHAGAYNVALAKVITLRKGTINNELLFYYYLSHFYQDFCVKAAYGRSAQAGFNRDDLASLMFPLPPLAEQQRIVDRIESLFAKLDEAKEKSQIVVDGFEDRRAAILHKAFTGELTEEWRRDNSISNESWKLVGFDDCVVAMQNGIAKRKGFTGEPYVVLRLANLSDDGFDETDLREIVLDEKEQKNYELHSDDVLMVRVNGSKDNVGKQYLITNQKRWAFCDHIIRIKYVNSIVPQYMVYFSKSETYRQYIKDNMVSSAGQNTISRKGMARLQIPMPQKDEQEQIVSILSNLFEKEQQAKEAAEHVINQIDTMKKSILARAFRGELGTNDPADESAEELLKRIL